MWRWSFNECLELGQEIWASRTLTPSRILIYDNRVLCVQTCHGRMLPVERSNDLLRGAKEKKRIDRFLSTVNGIWSVATQNFATPSNFKYIQSDYGRGHYARDKIFGIGPRCVTTAIGREFIFISFRSVNYYCYYFS